MDVIAATARPADSCTPETFTTKHSPFFSAAPAHAGIGTVVVDGMPPGRYAIQAYHDEDGNGRVRRGLFGIPAEAIGFSAPRAGPARCALLRGCRH